jgi:signal transduction histidine kinase/ligand-binding sensor domain-containing protein
VAPQLRHYHRTSWRFGDEIPVSEGTFNILRTPDGYLWLGSPQGLLRFDGVRFALLDPANTPALRATPNGGRLFVPHLVDHAGRMWILRPDGALLTYARGALRVAIPPDPARGIRYGWMYQGGAGTLWVQVDSGGRESMRGFREGRVVPGVWPADVPDDDVLGIVPDTADGMWVGTRAHGLWHVTPRGSRHHVLPVDPATGRRTTLARPIRQGADGVLWVLVGNAGLQRLRGNVWTAVTLNDGTSGPGLPLSVGNVAEAADGSVYIASRGHGLLRWRAGRVDACTPKGGVTSPRIERVLLGDADDVWALTDVGVDRFRRPAFTTLDRQDGVPFDAPHQIVEDASGAIWITSVDDPHLQRLDGGAVRGLSGPMTTWPAPVPNSFRGELLTRVRGGGVWMALESGGLMQVDQRGAVRRVPDAAQPTDRFTRGVDAADGTLWLKPSRRGIARLRDGRYTPVHLAGVDDETDLNFGTDDSARAVVMTDFRTPLALAVSGAGAARRLDTLGPLRRALRAAIVEGRDTVWAVGVGTPVLVRLTGGRATEVRSRSPLPALEGINVTLVVEGGSLWFGSGAGIGRFSLAALHAAADRGTPGPDPQVFTTADGLTAARLRAFGLRTMFGAHDGRVWVVTPAGLAFTDPARIPVNRVRPLVHVEEVVVEGRLLSRDTLRSGDVLRVPPNPERVAIHYTAASPRMPERVRLQYRLEGVDRGWMEGGVPRVATYTQLRPGRYRFRVRAWNEDGVPSAGEATLALRVLPAWYQTWWSQGLGLAAVAAAGAGGAWSVARLRQQRVEAARRATLAERSRVARELHDTLLSAVAGIAMRLDAATMRAAREVPPTSGGADASMLAEMRDEAYRTLSDARRSVTDLRTVGNGALPLSGVLAEAGRRIFAESGVDARVECEGAECPYPAALEDQVVRVATEAMTNALKHAGCRTVVTTCTYTPRELRVRVRDDGRGFDPALTGAVGHWGLMGMRERAAAIGARLTVKSAPGRGTDVLLVVPHSGRG